MLPTILAAAAGPLIGRGLEMAAPAVSEYFGGEDTILGDFFGGFAAKPKGTPTFAQEIGSAVAGALTPSKSVGFADLPSVDISAPRTMAAVRMQAAGQAAQIPLGSGNTVPNYLQRSNVRNTLARVQTIPFPRVTALAAKPNIPLGSAVVKSRTRRKTAKS